MCKIDDNVIKVTETNLHMFSSSDNGNFMI